MAENDTLLLYTDGLIERRREDLAIGMRRLTDFARTTSGLDIAELCDRFLHHPSPRRRSPTTGPCSPSASPHRPLPLTVRFPSPSSSPHRPDVPCSADPAPGLPVRRLRRAGDLGRWG
ncbi:hypothetical protein BV882_19695 [Streptomyces sp. 46]|nr:hypothetical protein BV882_19695 [Streptomyces sp. 46]